MAIAVVTNVPGSMFAIVNGKRQRVGKLYEDLSILYKQFGKKAKNRQAVTLEKALIEKVGKVGKTRFGGSIANKPIFVKGDSLVTALRNMLESSSGKKEQKINILSDDTPGAETGRVNLNTIKSPLITDSTQGEISFTQKQRLGDLQDSLVRTSGEPIDESLSNKDLMMQITKTAAKLKIPVNDLIFRMAKDNRNLGTIFFNSGGSVKYTYKAKGSENIKVASVELSYSEFLSGKNITASIIKNSIVFSASKSFEKKLMNQLSTTAIDESKDDIVVIQKAFDKFAKGQSTRNTVGLVGVTTFGINIGQTGLVKATGVSRRKKGASKKVSATNFMNNLQITILAQRRIQAKMPSGPIGGKPLSPTRLTYRTGNFVNSIKVFQDFKRRLITFNYAKPYAVHEATKRNPIEDLLKPSIREIVQPLYGGFFKVIRKLN